MDTGLLRRLNGKESTCQWRRLKRHKFDPRVGKIPWREIPWRRKWHPTPVFLPGESHGQRSLAGYSPWGHTVGHSWATEHTHTDGHNLFKQARLWVTPDSDPVTCVQATYTGGVRCRESVHGLKDTCSHSGQTDQQVLIRTTLQAFYASNFILFLISQFTILCAAPWSLFAGGPYREWRGKENVQKEGKGISSWKTRGFSELSGPPGWENIKEGWRGRSFPHPLYHKSFDHLRLVFIWTTRVLII